MIRIGLHGAERVASDEGLISVLSTPELLLMKATDGRMAGKTADSSIKWQLCYDMTARTWWMVSLVLFGVFFFLRFFPPIFLSDVTPPSVRFIACLREKVLQSSCLSLNSLFYHLKKLFSNIYIIIYRIFL